MRHLHRLLAIGLIGLVAAGCTSPADSPSPTAEPTSSPAPTADPPASSDSPEPVPSEDL